MDPQQWRHMILHPRALEGLTGQFAFPVTSRNANIHVWFVCQCLGIAFDRNQMQRAEDNSKALPSNHPISDTEFRWDARILSPNRGAVEKLNIFPIFVSADSRPRLRAPVDCDNIGHNFVIGCRKNNHSNIGSSPESWLSSNRLEFAVNTSTGVYLYFKHNRYLLVGQIPGSPLILFFIGWVSNKRAPHDQILINSCLLQLYPFDEVFDLRQ